ncbi:MAG TPA: M14 family metallopeptidase, partial [Pyrinomonadaceae bacterium]|nr:M14 family metallopeptidase [Pyrinomonadaceae bacterium]
MLDCLTGKVSFVLPLIAAGDGFAKMFSHKFRSGRHTNRKEFIFAKRVGKRTRSRFYATSLIVAAVLYCCLSAAAQVPTPRSVLGFTPADDKAIADWRQITDYFARLDKSSGRVTVKEIGKTTLGKPLIVAFISSERNIRELEKYRKISARLADPRTIGDSAEADDLIRLGKTIVSISCSIHSTEIVASQMSMNLAYELASAQDADTKEILDNTILLLIPSPNPDGIDIVADWYRKTLGTKSEGTSPPELYHHYAGHDDNRDWFMLNLKETQAITKLFWQEWFPQIVYDVHQQGKNASRFIIPPFFDPVNPRISPSILREAGLLGYKMAADLQAKNIAGVATNSTYDTWWHGGFRSAPYFHNSIGILSEAASADLMSPVTIQPDDLKKARAVRGLASLTEAATNYPDPWKGGSWRPRNIAEIEMTASRALLQMAAKFRPRYLRNFYDLGKANLVADPGEPAAFVITAGQPNGESVSRLIEILMWQGIEVQEMTRELHVKTSAMQREFGEIPLGSFLIFVNQPQKNNVLSLFERQQYPHRVNANGEAEVPYDVAGWTLPLQMGVEYETAWQIKDLEKERASLRRVPFINHARAMLNLDQTGTAFAPIPVRLRTNSRVGLYKGFTGSMDEGWTREVFDMHKIQYRSISDADMRGGNLDVDVIVLPADGENAIVNGLSAERYPAEFAGGIGEAGVENLKKFVDKGGKLICFDDSCGMVIKRFGLPIKNVLGGLKRNEFYNPGSIVRLSVDRADALAKNMPGDAAA